MLGVLLAGRAQLRRRNAARPLFENAEPLVLTIVMATLFVRGVTRIGFFTASAALMLLSLPVLGLRRLWLVIFSTLVFVALVCAIFCLILGKPLPTPVPEAILRPSPALTRPEIQVFVTVLNRYTTLGIPVTEHTG